MTYMIYILEELQMQPSVVDIAELKSAAVLLTSDGLIRPADDPVHFSVAYSGFDLSATLSGYNWHFAFNKCSCCVQTLYAEFVTDSISNNINNEYIVQNKSHPFT